MNETAILEELLSVAWEGRPPASEIAALAQLPVDKRETVTRRLGALIELRDSSSRSQARTQAIADAAGIDRANLYALLRKWNEAPSITHLIPYASRQPTRRLDGERVQLIGQAIDELRADVDYRVSGESVIRLAQQLCSDRGLAKPSGDAVRRVLKERRSAAPVSARQSEHAEAAGKNAPRQATRERRVTLGRSTHFGELIVVDTAAMNLLTSNGFRERRARVTFVIDDLTRIILGWTWVGVEAPLASHYASASQMAAESLKTRAWGALPRSGTKPTFLLVYANYSMLRAREAAVLSNVSRGLGHSYVEAGPRKFGDYVARLLPKGISGVSLKPRTIEVDRGTRRARDLAVGDPRIVEALIEQHNEARLAKLKAEGIMPRRRPRRDLLRDGLSALADSIVLTLPPDQVP